MQLRLGRERTLGRCQRIQSPANVCEHLVVEPGANVTRVVQAGPLFVPVSQDERPEFGTPTSLAAGKATDHQFRCPHGFDLEPRGGPIAGCIRAVALLRDDSLKTRVDRRMVERKSIARRMYRFYVRHGKEALVQVAPPVFVRAIAQVQSQGMGNIEGIENSWRAPFGFSDLAIGFELRPILQRVERRFAVLKHQDLAIDDEWLYWLLPKLCCNEGKRRGKVQPPARAERCFSVGHEREDAVAVQLRLMEPSSTSERLLRSLAQHGSKLRG